MSDRRYGFLWEDERQYIDAYREPIREMDRSGTDFDEIYDERLSEALDNPRQVKSRLKNEAASVDSLREALVSFREDLLAVQWFYTQVADQPEGTYEFLEYHMPLLESEIQRLQETLDRWNEWAEQQDDLSDEIRADIGDCLEPLHQDLERIAQVMEEGPSSELAHEYRKANAGADDADPEFVREVEERSTRRKVLAVLLQNPDLRELFEWIAANPKRKLPSEQIGGNTWKWWCSTKLKNEHELVEESGWGFELTPRGEAVRESLNRFDEADVFGKLDEKEDFEWTLSILEFFHGGDEWEE